MQASLISFIILLLVYIVLKVIVYKKYKAGNQIFLVLHTTRFRWILIGITALFISSIFFGISYMYALLWLVGIQCVDMVLFIGSKQV
ncbi:hypothetical protein ACWG0P_03955 [Amedibacillus sp. YH-ame6]